MSNPINRSTGASGAPVPQTAPPSGARSVPSGGRERALTDMPPGEAASIVQKGAIAMLARVIHPSTKSVPAPKSRVGNPTQTVRKEQQAVRESIATMRDTVVDEVHGLKSKAISLTDRAKAKQLRAVASIVRGNAKKIRRLIRKRGAASLKTMGHTFYVIKGSKPGRLVVLLGNVSQGERSGKLGFGSDKQVELGISVGSDRYVETVAVARSLRKGTTEDQAARRSRIRTEHRVATQIKRKCGLKRGIFCSRAVTNIGKGAQQQVGMILPLANGDYNTRQVNPTDPVPPAKLLPIGDARTPGTKLGNAAHLLRVLDRMHEKGYVHADFRPDNIFLASDNVAEIADWGVAFTRSYMAPGGKMAQDLVDLRKKDRELDALAKRNPEAVDPATRKEIRKEIAFRSEADTKAKTFASLCSENYRTWATTVLATFRDEEITDGLVKQLNEIFKPYNIEIRNVGYLQAQKINRSKPYGPV